MAVLVQQDVVTSRSTPVGRKENHFVNQLLVTVAVITQNNTLPEYESKSTVGHCSDPVIHHPNIYLSIAICIFIAVDTETSITET
jgi:hypothetical protein